MKKPTRQPETTQKKPDVRVTLRLPEEDRDYLDELANQRGVSLSTVLRGAIRRERLEDRIALLETNMAKRFNAMKSALIEEQREIVTELIGTIEGAFRPMIEAEQVKMETLSATMTKLITTITKIDDTVSRLRPAPKS